MKNKKAQKNLRHKRVRKNISGKADIPRLVVFRSNKHLYAQIIDDTNARTLASQSDINIKQSKSKNKLEAAKEIGSALAKKAVEKKIKRVVFDRAGYKYHGRVKSLAEGAKEGGLIF